MANSTQSGNQCPTALVTGSTSGIGLAIAEALLSDGYQVVVHGRDEQKGALVAAQLNSRFAETAGAQATFVAADVATEQGAEQIAAFLQQQRVSLDVLVTNVGSGRARNEAVLAQSEYQQIFDTNFFSAVNLCGKLLPAMASPGNIICVSSIAGVVPLGAPVAYACAKAALNMFVKEWAMRLANQNITVNSISPGNVMFPGSVWDNKMQADSVGTQQYINDNVPLQNFVKPTEIAQMVCQITRTPMLTGQNIVIDGGQSRGVS